MDGKAYKELIDGEVECSICSGTGREGMVEPHINLYFVCSFCNGDGKVDWVKDITKTFHWNTFWLPNLKGGFKNVVITTINGGSGGPGKTIWGQKVLTKIKK